MTGRMCYERFVAAMGDGPPFDELPRRVKAAWDAVADPNAPRQRGRSLRPMIATAPAAPHPAADSTPEHAPAPDADAEPIVAGRGDGVR